MVGLGYLRGSESRLHPLPAAMKWMFKEDHSLGKHSGRCAGRGAAGAGGPPPPGSGRPGPGRAGQVLRSGLGSPGLGSSGLGPPGQASPGLGRPLLREDGVREPRWRRRSDEGPGLRRSPGAGGPGRAWGPEPARRAGAAVIPVCFPPRTQMRGIREDSSEISRSGSGECWGLPAPSVSCHPLAVAEPGHRPRAIVQAPALVAVAAGGWAGAKSPELI